MKDKEKVSKGGHMGGAVHRARARECNQNPALHPDSKIEDPLASLASGTDRLFCIGGVTGEQEW